MVSFDGALSRSQQDADLLVGLAANDEFKNLPLARRQFANAGLNDI